MPDRISNIYTSDAYKQQKHYGSPSKPPNKYSKAMSNDDLYKMIHNNRGDARNQISFNNLEDRKKENRQRRVVHEALSLIPDDDEEDELSDAGKITFFD